MIPPVRFLLNDREQSVSQGRGTVLLDALRDDLGLTGTKDACREGDCGSCLVLLGTPGPEGVATGPSTPASCPWARPRIAMW